MEPARAPTAGAVPGRAAPLLAVGSGALYALCFPPVPAAAGEALAWVALVPLALALRGRGPAGAAALTALWACVATAVVVRWVAPTLQDHFGWSQAASLLFLAALAGVTAAPFFGLCFALSRMGVSRRGPVAAAAAFAAAFVAAELLRGHLGLRSPWAALGATQHGAERVRQLADLAGFYGVSGLVAFVNALFAEALALAVARRPRGVWLTPLGVASLACIAAAGYGEWRIRSFSAATDERLEVVLVQGNVPAELRWQRSHASRVLRRYGRLTRDALGAETDLVIWPENAIQTPIDDPTYGPPLRGLARGAPLLVGAPRREPGGRHWNSAHLIHPDGRVESYDKRRLLPFAESRPWGGWASLESRGDLDGGAWVAGRRPGIFRLERTTLGVLICLEGLYPELAREAVGEGAEVLVNLSNDAWFVGAGALEQHFGQVVFRAIETRRPVLRATPTGLTAIVTPLGELQASLAPGTKGSLRASVPRATGPPALYAQVGDVFALACLLACAAGPLRALAGRLPRRAAQSETGWGRPESRSPGRIA